MPRYIDLSDKAKASVQLRDIRKTDFEAEFARLDSELKEIDASYEGKRRDRFRAQTIRDIEYTKRMQTWAQTGRPVEK